MEKLVTKASNVFIIFSFGIKIKKLEHVGKQENQTEWQLRAYFPLPYASENPEQPSSKPQRHYHCTGSHHFDRKDALDLSDGDPGNRGSNTAAATGTTSDKSLNPSANGGCYFPISR